MNNESPFLPGLECPESIQTTYFDIIKCNLNDKPCVLQEFGAGFCPTYEEFLNDIEEEMMEDTL